MPLLTVEDVARLTGWGERRVRRAFARWQRRGFPRVSREPCRGDHRGRLVVDAAEYYAVQAGELSECPVSEAA